MKRNTAPKQDTVIDLARRLEELRAERGDSVRLDDVGDVVTALMETMQGDVTAFDVVLHQELTSLLDYIHTARSEIASIRPEEIHDQHIPDASDELDAVVQATEEATSAILEAAEELETLGERLSGEDADAAVNIATKIYEASTFQDITGQRITKVVRTLKHIEDKIATLAKACGHELKAKAKDSSKMGAQAQAMSDEDLLNGPSMPEEAISQNDIDALFGSFD